jgi:hypothetical protein
MKFSDRCVPWKIASGAENLVLQALQFQHQNGGLSVLPSIGKQRIVGWVGDDSHVVFDQKCPCPYPESD